MVSRTRLHLPGALIALTAATTLSSALTAPPTLEVGWISREPRFRAPETIDGPRTAGWPEEGRAVHWIGHLLNRGTTTVEAVPYVWSIDGVEELRGVVDLVPGDNEVILPWRWTFTRHQIDLAIDGDHVTIDSDALSIAFYVDRTEYNRLIGSYLGSFERRMQRQIPYWNSVFADAVHPTTPNGVLDRWRIDKVIVQPDGSRIPDEDYFDTDLFWVFPISGSFFSGAYEGDQTVLLHELLHQRGLVDDYAYEVAHYFSTGPFDGRVDVIDHGTGKAVAGTFLMPQLPDSRNVGGIFVYHLPAAMENVMAHNYFRGAATLTEVNANGLNLIHHRRSPVTRWPAGGILLGLKNIPQPANYVNLLPSETALTFIDNGRPVTGGVVEVFMDQNPTPYRDSYSAEPQFTFGIDGDGVAVMPGDVLQNQPPWRQPPKAQTILFRVRTGSARAYVFVPVWEFNRLYFRDGGGPSAFQTPVKMIAY